MAVSLYFHTLLFQVRHASPALHLLVDLGNHTGANRPSAFAYRKTQTFFHRNRCNQ
jgi:hypothetical protein